VDLVGVDLVGVEESWLVGKKKVTYFSFLKYGSRTKNSSLD
jgi:hypothetical protein